MRHVTHLAVIGLVLVTWIGIALADVPQKVQAVLDKQANGQQLASKESEILDTYLNIDQTNIISPGETDTQWGPDGWGYTARDANSGGPTYHWYDNTTFGTEFWSGEDRDNDWTPAIYPPFHSPTYFPIYGNNESHIYISANAIIAFSDINFPSYSQPVPSLPTTMRIDPWVYDMYHLGSASHYYYQSYSDTMFSISFMDIRYQDPAYRNDPNYSQQFQVLLYSDGRITFQYRHVGSRIPGSPYNSGIDDTYDINGLTWGDYFVSNWAIGFYPPTGFDISNPRVTPIIGESSTAFHYYVDYTSQFGIPPDIKQILIDGTPYTMHDPGGDYRTGVTFDYGPVFLGQGSHEYSFNFGFGSHTIQSPSSGTHSGPIVTTPRTLPYMENFDSNNGDFASSDPTVWQWGDPVYSYPYNTQSEPNCWGTVIDGDFPSNACASLITPPIILDPDTKLTFYHWYYFGAGGAPYAGGNLKISIDNGATWTSLTPEGGYPETLGSFNACIPEELAYSSAEPYWHMAIFDLSPYASQTAYIKWVFGSDYNPGYYGWFIDNVVVAKDYCMSLHPETQSGIGLNGQTMQYLVNIENCGRYDDTYYLTASISGENWYTELRDGTGITEIDSVVVPAGAIDSFLVYVEIPDTAVYPDSSRASVIATSAATAQYDTIFVSTTTRMANEYDIGGGGNDFPSLVSAAIALQAVGVMAPTTFNVFDGIYDTPPVSLPATIVGMGSSNPIVFRNAPGNFPQIRSGNVCFSIDGADYITIQGMELRSSGQYAVNVTHSGADSATHIYIMSNYIHHPSNAGIHILRGRDCRICNNEIQDAGYGIVCTYGDYNLIDNNMIYNTDSYGIRMEYGNNNYVAYNSCYISSNSPAAVAFSAFETSNLFVADNIFFQNGLGRAYSIEQVDISSIQSDYNDIFAPNGILGYYLTNLMTLPEFQTATGLDEHSISADPNFANISVLNYDLHIDTTVSSPVNNSGTPLAQVTTDFDGDLRDLIAPDIGADEFEGLGPPEAVHDLAITLSGTSRDSTDITIIWSPTENAQQYHIYRSDVPVGGFAMIGSTTDTTYTDTDAIINEATSFYYVTADNEP